MQKKINENTMNMNGTCSHPMPRSVRRNATSMGKVTQRRVIITRRGEGGGDCFRVLISSVENSGRPVRATDVACRAVERRETKMEPTLPGRPARAKNDQRARRRSKEGEKAYRR